MRDPQPPATCQFRNRGHYRLADLPLLSNTEGRRTQGRDEGNGALVFLDFGGEMAGLIRTHDWASTPLGPPEQWPPQLRSNVSLMLRSLQPIYIAWGPQLTALYNDTHRPFLGSKHPDSLGKRSQDVWSDIWETTGRLLAAAMAGQAQWHEDVPLELDGGGRHRRWFSFSYTPIEDDDGNVLGVMTLATETTSKVLTEQRLAAERARQIQLFEQAPGFISTTAGPEHVFDFVNAEHRKLFDSEHWVGRTVREAFPERYAGRVVEQLDRIYATGERLVKRDVRLVLEQADGPGTTYYLDFIYEPLLDPVGGVVGIFCQGSDVTDRVLAVQAMAASEERYRQIVEGAEDFAIITFDSLGVITSWNTGAQRMLGYTGKEAIGRSGEIFFNEEDRASGAMHKELARAAAEGRAVDERWHQRKDGSVFWGSGLMMQLDRGDAFLKIFRDRTQEHAQEASLKRRSEQLQELAETALSVARTDSVEATIEVITEAARGIVGTHQAAVSLTHGDGWGRAINTAVLSEKYSQWRDYSVAPAGMGIYALVCEKNQPIRMTQAQLQAHPRWHNFSGHASEHPPMRGWLAAPLVGRDDRNLGLIQLSDKQDGSDFDEADEALLVQLAQVASAAMEQSLIEDALRNSEEQLRLATDAAEVALWDVDVTNGAVYWQPRLKAMFGMQPDAEVTMDDFFAGLHPDDRQASIDAVAAAMDPAIRAMYDLEYRTIGSDGTQRWVAGKGRCLFDDAGVCVRMIGTAIDITARKCIEAQLLELNETLERRVAEQTDERMKAEDALRQAHKMEAVGQLTGGIAHDFNNMLGAVVGSFELILRRPADLERVQRYAEAGLQAAERGTRLTSQLLAFSRAQQIEMKPVILFGVVNGMRAMLRNALGPMVRLTLDLDEEAVPVLADSTQLEMAVLNLAINARDAMPEGGEVTIATQVRAISNDVELADGEYVELCVSDSGAGMDPEVAARAFEPFFTTKGVGKGTGLGLSQVYGIARQAGGTVRLDSQPGAGTTVRILLPGTQVGIEAVPGHHSAAEAHAQAQASITVLVVDDDPNVREVLVETLDSLGYRVLAAEDGPSGLAALEAGVPDLLMLDFAMPGMNGAEVAKVALERHHDLPIVFATGYADTAAIIEVAGPQALVLRKPFRVNELQAMLELALKSRR